MKYTIEVKRLWIVMAVAYLKSGLAKAAWSHKIVERIEQFLKDHPGNTYRVTAEAIDEKATDAKEGLRDDRESEEERADPAGSHYR